MGYENVRSGLRKGIPFFLLLATVFLALDGTAHAFSSYLSAFNTKYGTSATKLNTCSTCHGSGGTSTWNPYGESIRTGTSTSLPIADRLTAVEPLDSDGDGFTNIVEINARTFPGDPADHPAPSDTTPPTVSSTTPASGASGVAVNTAVTATFSEAVQNVSTTTFTLRAGTTSVSGSATVSGSTATFTPSAPLAYSTTYTATLTTGVTDLANNALATAYSWSFTTGAAPDTTPPTVSSTNPANGATGVATNAAVTASFSEAVKNVSATTFQLRAGATSVAGTVSLSGTTATFTPSAPLAYSTTYTATLTTGVTDLANNALAAAYSWTFTTGAAPDTTPPTVSVTSPVSGATAVPVSTTVSATFSEAVKNVSTATFTLRAGATSVAGTVTLSGTTATFTPSAPLAYSTTYTATISTGVTDLANNALAAAYSWSFTTGAAADTTPPTVSATSPADLASAVAVNTAVTATFSEPVKNVNTTTFQLRAGATSVAGTVTMSGSTATFTPAAPLAYSTTYTATLSTGVTDLANNALAAAYSWSFTTGAASDTTPPTVGSTMPTSGQTGVATNTVVRATFSETIDASSVNATTFTLKDGAGASVAGVVTASGTTATFTPSAPLAGSTTYTATVSTGIKDMAGNALASAYSWSFTTIAASIDSDDDGVDDAEDDYPRDDRRGTPHNPKGHGKIDIDTSENSGTHFRAISAMSDMVATMSAVAKPAGYDFRYGILSYRVEGVVPGATIRVKITYPDTIPAGTKAYKVDSSGYHEYSRVSFSGNTMTVTLTDGGAGDSDGVANGVIVDPIGLASPAEAPQSAGGGCSIAGAPGRGENRAGSDGMLLLLAVALIGARAATRKAARS